MNVRSEEIWIENANTEVWGTNDSSMPANQGVLWLKDRQASKGVIWGVLSPGSTSLKGYTFLKVWSCWLHCCLQVLSCQMSESDEKAQHTCNISVERRRIPREQEIQNANRVRAGHGLGTESSSAKWFFALFIEHVPWFLHVNTVVCHHGALFQPFHALPQAASVPMAMQSS